MNAKLFVSGQSIPQKMAVSASTLTEAFPWLAPTTTAGGRGGTLGDEFAAFAQEASEWAELTGAAAFETWPDE